MLKFYVERDVRLRQLRQCPVGMHMDGLAEWLHAAGYKRRPAQLVLRGAAHLAHWTSAGGGPIDRIDEGVLQAFADHLGTCACPSPFRGRDRYHRDGAQRLVAHLRRVGVLPPSNAESEMANAAGASPVSLAGELWAFMRQNKKWWLGPIVVVLLLLGVLIFLAGSSAAPFIYTLF